MTSPVKINVDKLVSLGAALAAVVIPVLIQDHVVSGPTADVLGAVVGSFVVGYHVPSPTRPPKPPTP